MSLQTCICLQARPDFSAFWFTLGIRGAVLMEMRFVGRKGNIFDLILDRRYLFEDPHPTFFNEQDVDTLLYAVVQAIELFTGKYPERSVRCKPGDRIQTSIFRIILRSNKDIMATLFSIDEEGKDTYRPFGGNPENSSFLLKRKPDPQRRPQPMHLTLNTYSQLFGSPVYVRLNEQNRVATPAL